MTDKIKTDSEQFWDWFPRKLEEYNMNYRIRQDEIKTWLQKISEEWAAMPTHNCGYKATKTEYERKGGYYDIKEIISCAYCKTTLKTIDRRKEYQEHLKKDIVYHQRMLQEINEALL